MNFNHAGLKRFDPPSPKKASAGKGLMVVVRHKDLSFLNVTKF